MNNSNRPVDLAEKIQYLHEKIDYTNLQLKQNGSFEMKMKFIDFIDTTIENLYRLDHKQSSGDNINKKYEEYYKAEENEKERQRIDREKEQMNERLREIKDREKQVELEALKIEIQNFKIVKANLINESNEKQKELKQYIFELEKKIKGQEKEIQKLIRINSLQNKENDNIKEERNRAEKAEIEWRQRYDRQIGLLETFGDKKSKYMYRNNDGLKILRSISNKTTELKGQERLFLCDLPMKFHIVKIIYGIKVGLLMPNRQIDYFEGVSLYEREQMQLLIEGQILVLKYLKRKVTVKLDKYKAPKGQVIIMLFGRGDSVAIDESE